LGNAGCHGFKGTSGNAAVTGANVLAMAIWRDSGEVFAYTPPVDVHPTLVQWPYPLVVDEWVQLAKSIKGDAGTIDLSTGAPSKIDSIGVGNKILMTWSTSADPSDPDDPNSYEKAVEFTVPGTMSGGPHDPSGGYRQCTSEDGYVPVDITCVKGVCDLPSQMYTGTGFNRVCYDRAYGIVAKSSPTCTQGTSGCYGCDWGIDSQPYKALVLGNSGCHGYKSTSGTTATNADMLAIAIWRSAKDASEDVSSGVSPPVFGLQSTPITSISREAGEITEAEWPANFCINIDVTTPASVSGSPDFGLIGGRSGQCEGIYLYLRAPHTVGFGVQCNAGGSDSGLSAQDAYTDDGGRHIFKFCYNTASKEASVYADGTQLAQGTRNFNFDRFGKISVFAGLHHTDSETMSGATLHSLTITDPTVEAAVSPWKPAGDPDTRARCNSFTCPTSYYLRKEAPDIKCAGDICEEAVDKATCCKALTKEFPDGKCANSQALNWLHDFSLEECIEWAVDNGVSFFAYGKGTKEKRCWWQRSSANPDSCVGAACCACIGKTCTMESDQYDFFKVA